MIGASLLLCLSACKRDVSFSRPHIAADGRPQTCPDTPITEVMPGVPTRDTTRCSYADSVGQDRTQLSGTVLAEDPDNRSGLPMEGIAVTVHKAEGPGGSASGNALGHATTDAQGHFNVSAILEPGDYELVAVSANGRPLGRARVVLAEGVTRRVENLRLLVPMDPKVRRAREAAAAAQPSGASSPVPPKPASPSAATPETGTAPDGDPPPDEGAPPTPTEGDALKLTPR